MIDPRTLFLEDEYHFIWDDLNVEIVVERIRLERGALRADFTPQSATGSGWLPSQTIDLVSGESAKRYANVLGSRLLDPETWFELVTDAQRRAREHYRAGDPSVVLRDVKWAERPRFALYPFLESNVRSMLFGDGGVSKSLHAMAMCVSVATGIEVIPGTRPLTTGPVAYLDWEDEPETHAERLTAICCGVGIEVPENIIYMRRVGALHESTREIKRELARVGAVFSVVDSVGAAIGGDPERASDVIRCFDAMRALDTTVLAIHHVTKDQKDKSKPFGSVYSPNLCRITWRLDRESGRQGEIFVRGQSFKGNNVGALPPLGHRVVFETDADDRLTVVRFENTQMRPGTTEGSLRNRIGAVLKQYGTLTVDEIAAEIGSSAPTVRTTLNRNKDWFTAQGEGWGLLDPSHNTVTKHPDNTTPVLRNNTRPLKGGVTTPFRSESEDEEMEPRFHPAPSDDDELSPAEDWA